MILEINSINVHFQVFGSGAPLLVLHGWGDSGATWLAVAQELSSRFQVFLLDLPGFGGSDAPAVAWNIEQYRDTVLAFVHEMELESPLIIGHSHGGKIACECIAQGLKVSGLVLVASSGVDLPSLQVKFKVYAFKAAKFVLLRFGDWGKQKVAELRNRLGSRDYREAGPLRDTMVRVVNHKLFATLPKIHVPTLILWGSKDSTLPMDLAKVFRKNLPGSYIRILWDATHHPHLEQPKELAQYVTEFVYPDE